MNFKEFILPFTLAILSVWFLNYWFFGSKENVQNGHNMTPNSFVAPNENQAYKALKKNVDFFDEHITAKTEIETVQTKWGSIEFSSGGAIINSMEFYRSENIEAPVIRTLFPKPMENVEDSALLVAFETETPLAYTLIDKKNLDTGVALKYKSQTNKVEIIKEFFVHNDIYQVDISLQINSLNNDNIDSVRILYPSPIMSDIVSRDVISSVLVSKQEKFLKTSADKIDLQMGWFNPVIFGADNKYFLHALVKDDTHFVQRAYYKKGANNELISILETAPIEKSADMNLSFYFGPKQEDAFLAVDKRLENDLEYSGFFYPLAKVLLVSLKWLHKRLNNFGFAIIVLVLLLQILFMPLTMKREKAMKQQKEMQKKMAYLKAKYKNDPERLNIETAALLQKEGIGGLVGCLLPALLQMPIFFGLRNILNGSLELYKAPMLWISDLSIADPYYILPVVFTLGMIAQSLFSNVDAKQRSSSFAMAIVFGGLMSAFSSGLVLYMTVNLLFSVLQSFIVKKLGRS